MKFGDSQKERPFHCSLSIRGQGWPTKIISPTILKKQTQNSSRLDHKLTKREQEKKKREKKMENKSHEKPLTF